MVNFEEFFKQATGHEPFPYQTALAKDASWPSLVSVPTGLGKTAAAILGWVWRRRFAQPEVRQQTPRRLVYCLPMRVLVEQTHGCAIEWLANLNLLGGELSQGGEYEPSRGKDDPSRIRVHLLLGGDVDRDWDAYPERDAILVGTQDMLLSRALNRGYAMSRFRWPIQFGLLNNDCLWVLDEVQLMGSGLATTAQLQAFRRKLGVATAARSTWMSATMRPEWLATVDFDRDKDAAGSLEIGIHDKQHPVLRPRFEASKPLERAPFEATTDGVDEAAFVLVRHTPGSRSLVVVNTVKRARAIFESLRKKKPKANLILVHSRFRPNDREARLAGLLADPGPTGTIGICTQVIEAGVDVSARLLVTDLAPWASLVQRFGRCNRKGEFNQDRSAAVVWVAPPDLDNEQKVAPYLPEELHAAADRLATLTNVGPARLPPFDQAMAVTQVIRRKDLVDLFDTTPDLAGGDLDVSRFIRETDDHDVRVFWRDIADHQSPTSEAPAPSRTELCAVPVAEIRDWAKGRSIWRYDHLTKEWRRPEAIYPGLVLMLRASDGGYSADAGWNGKEKFTPPVGAADREPEADGEDPLSEKREWASIAKHTDAVVGVASQILDAVSPAADSWRQVVLQAARWHDVGKAHAIFQGAVPDGAPNIGPWAKTEPKMRGYQRPGFRHELASAIAMLLNGHCDLAAYLAAAHHGKVRLSIRSLPHEKPPRDNMQKRFARGVWDGDRLPATDLGGATSSHEIELDLSFMELGEGQHGPSWLARMVALRDDPTLGPFRLAFLEALLRVADWRASGGEVSK